LVVETEILLEGQRKAENRVVPHTTNHLDGKIMLRKGKQWGLALLVQCLHKMLPLNHFRTTSSSAPPIFYVTKNLAIKRFFFGIARGVLRIGF